MPAKSKRSAARSRKKPVKKAKAKSKAKKKPLKKRARKKTRSPSSISNASVAQPNVARAGRSVASSVNASLDAPFTTAYSPAILAEVMAFFRFHLGDTPFTKSTILNPFFPGNTWTNLRIEFVEDLHYNFPAGKWEQPQSCESLATYMTDHPERRTR